MADKEVLDDADAYPYSSHISIDGHELKIGDLLLVFEDAKSPAVNWFERIYGFTWGKMITHVIDGVVPAESHDIDALGEDLQSTKKAIARKWHQDSYRVDEDTVRRLSLYRYYYGDGVQPILVDETRALLSTDFSHQALTICKDSEELIEEVYQSTKDPDQEAEPLQDILSAAGFGENVLPDDHSLDSYES